MTRPARARKPASEREVALDARWSRTAGTLLVVTGVTCAITAVTADEPSLYVVAAIAELFGLRCWLSATPSA
jgi:hypothetical protein